MRGDSHYMGADEEKQVPERFEFACSGKEVRPSRKASKESVRERGGKNVPT